LLEISGYPCLVLGRNIIRLKAVMLDHTNAEIRFYCQTATAARRYSNESPLDNVSMLVF